MSNIGGAQEVITLKRATELVVENNLQVKQAKLYEARSKENLKLSQLSLYPTLSASNNLNLNFGRSIDPATNQFVNNSVTSTEGGIFSGFTIFQGFQKLNQISHNKYALEADKSNTQKIKNELVLLVIVNYLSILSNKDLLAAAQQQNELSILQLKRAQKLFDVGNTTMAELSQAKAQLASSELNVVNAQNQLDLSFLALAQLLEFDSSKKFDVEKPIVEASQVNALDPLEISKIALETFPEIRLAKSRTFASRKAFQLAKGNYYPTLSLQARLDTRYSDGTFFDRPFSLQIRDNLSQSVGFRLSIPIFNGNSVRSSVTLAKIDIQNSELNEQLAKNTLVKTINQAVLDARAAEKRFKFSEVAFQGSKSAFNAIEKRFEIGLVNSFDLNQAQANLNKAHFDMIQAKYDLVFKNKLIDYYQGAAISF